MKFKIGDIVRVKDCTGSLGCGVFEVENIIGESYVLSTKPPMQRIFLENELASATRAEAYLYLENKELRKSVGELTGKNMTLMAANKSMSEAPATKENYELARANIDLRGEVDALDAKCRGYERDLKENDSLRAKEAVLREVIHDMVLATAEAVVNTTERYV